MADKTPGAYNIADLRELALKRVPKGRFGFVDRGPECLHSVDPWFGPIIENRLRQRADYPKAVARA